MSASLKKNVIVSFASSLSTAGLEKNNIILTTSAGLISGRPLPPETDFDKAGQDDRPMSADEIYAMLLRIADENFDGDVEGNDGYLMLTDAKIRNQNTTYNLGSVVVFYDQIIGVSLGSLD